MHDDLRVRLAFKDVAFRQKLLPEHGIVFDNPVMHDGKAPVVADMGVRVGIRGSAVGGPAGVSDAGGPGEASAILRLFAQTRDLAADLLQRDAPVPDHGDARGVIAPVLQPFQALQQQRGRLFASGEADDSTHVRLPP